MESAAGYLLAADLILFIHLLFVVFVVFGLVLVLAGGLFSWGWVRNPWFRLIHLCAICVVVIQSWLGVICPLTIWEMALRDKAGEGTYTGTFISHWMTRILYYSAPEWVFVACYTLFGLLVIASFFIVRPRRFRK